MRKLIRGIIDFRLHVRPGYRETFAKLALGQRPDVLMVACSDSRVAPNIFASTDPGDLFVVRNVGNLVPPCDTCAGRSSGDESEIAALEFAVRSLAISHIILCGHSECGAMRALYENSAHSVGPHMATWLRHAAPALEALHAGAKSKAELSPVNLLSQLNVREQISHLRTYDFINESIQAGNLRLHGLWFDIANAEVLALDPSVDEFVVIDQDSAERLFKIMLG